MTTAEQITHTTFNACCDIAATFKATEANSLRMIERERIGEQAKARAQALFDGRTEAEADIIGETFGAWAADRAWGLYGCVGPRPKAWTERDMVARLEALHTWEMT